jgi:hypothetical protein
MKKERKKGRKEERKKGRKKEDRKKRSRKRKKKGEALLGHFEKGSTWPEKGF